MAEKKELIANLSPADFTSNLSLIHGPMVVIYVGPGRTKFEVSKGLFCQASKFFDSAFNGPFKEGIDQEMEMIEDDPAVFEALVQYAYTGRVGSQSFRTPTEEITFILQFLILADKIALLDPCSIIVEKFIDLLLDSWTFEVIHLELAFKLPAQHTIRKLVVERCIPDYFDYMQGRNEHDNKSLQEQNFAFESALDIEGFAADLTKVAAKVYRKRTRPDGKRRVMVEEPFSRCYINVNR